MTIILGINAFHADASAALVRDGQVVCAAEEERFTRVKHSAGFPTSAIRWCLSDANISFDSIDHIAINSSPSSHRIRKALYTLLNRPSPGFLDRWRNKRERGGLAKQLSSLPDQTIKLNYTLLSTIAHLASAFFASPFDSAAVVSVDGFGDFASTAWGFGQGSDLTLDGQVFFHLARCFL